MKYLYLIRHALTHPLTAQQTDRERPLLKEGIDQAHALAHHLNQYQIKPDLILSSPAVRTQHTARILADILKVSAQDFVLQSILYEGSSKEIIDSLKTLPPVATTVFVIGHNPKLSQIAETLSHAPQPLLRPCGCLAIDLEIMSWQSLSDSVNTQVTKIEV
jgi:phosphohistidine phosphatase